MLVVEKLSSSTSEVREPTRIDIETRSDQPDRRVGELPLLTAAERQELLIARNATRAAYPADRCFHELFEAQVARTPHAIAVVFDGTKSDAQRAPGRTKDQIRHSSFVFRPSSMQMD